MNSNIIKIKNDIKNNINIFRDAKLIKVAESKILLDKLNEMNDDTDENLYNELKDSLNQYVLDNANKKATASNKRKVNKLPKFNDDLIAQPTKKSSEDRYKNNYIAKN